MVQSSNEVFIEPYPFTRIQTGVISAVASVAVFHILDDPVFPPELSPFLWHPFFAP